MQAWSSRPAPSLPEQPSARHRCRHSTPRAKSWWISARPPGPAGIYVCGITPYDATHIGHANTYVAFDLLNRSGATAGSRSITSRTSPISMTRCWNEPPLPASTGRALAEQQTRLYGEDMAALNVLPPRHYVGAVESMPLIVDLIEQLQRRRGRVSGGRQRVRGPVLRTGE